MESIKQTIEEMSSHFHAQMAHFGSELDKVSSRAPASSTSLAGDFEAFKSFVITALKGLQRQIEALAADNDRLEMHSRRKILLIHGVPETKEDNLAACVVKLAAERLKLSGFSASDISRCHRLGQAADNRTRPILLKLTNASVRNKMWLAKKCLKGSGVTISEFLTRVRHGLFMAARERHGVSKCWTRDGSIFVVGPDGSRHRITSYTELENIPCDPAPEAPKEHVRTQRKRVPPKK